MGSNDNGPTVEAVAESPSREELDLLREALAQGAGLQLQPPASRTRVRTEWDRFSFNWERAKLVAFPTPDNPNPAEEDIYLLSIQDPDTGNIQAFKFNEEAKQNLLRLMTSGIVLP